MVLTDQGKPVARLMPMEEARPDAAKPRVAGLHRGSMVISDDFDDYLGDKFWFGDSNDLG